MKSQNIENQNETKNLSAVIYSVLWQCMIISLFFAIFFLTAVSSSLFAGWDKVFKDAAVLGAVISGTVLLAFFSGWLFLFIRHGYYKKDYDIAGMGIILVISYIIRVGMTGTIQMDEGLNCYNDLKELLYHPELMLTDFMEAGKLAGRAAYGYNFFALMGEFMLPGTGEGFQWVQLYMGVAAACSIYGIFKKLFPSVKKIILIPAAFVVSVQPMFLGLSTMCGLEYGIVVFFLYALYCCLNKRYILMAFWLIMLATTKSTGAIIALCFVSSYLGANLIVYIRKTLRQTAETNSHKSNKQLIAISIITIAAVVIFAGTVWKICAINGISLKLVHVQHKLAQMYVLNFGWVWAIIVATGLVMVIFNRRVRDAYKMDFVPVFVLAATYMVHTAYLIFYTSAVLPRYDMLSDVLLCLIGVILLIKMFERIRVIIPVMLTLAILMLGEAFVTIDPVSSSTFATISTSGFPLVNTSYLKSELTGEINGVGDFSFYNYHYTVIYDTGSDTYKHVNPIDD